MRRLNQLNSTINTSPFAEFATKTVEDSTLDVIIITVKPRLTATSVIRATRYYGHYFLAAWRKPPSIFL